MKEYYYLQDFYLYLVIECKSKLQSVKQTTLHANGKKNEIWLMKIRKSKTIYGQEESAIPIQVGMQMKVHFLYNNIGIKIIGGLYTQESYAMS